MGKGRQEETKKDRVTREFSSGTAVFKKVGREIFWLVTKSSTNELYPKAYWRLPKGGIDDGETLEEAALRETREEGGVKATVVKKIETIKYFFTTPDKVKILKFVTFFLAQWESDLPGGFGEETSEIDWLQFDEAYKRLSFSGERSILKKASALLV